MEAYFVRVIDVMNQSSDLDWRKLLAKRQNMLLSTLGGSILYLLMLHTYSYVGTLYISSVPGNTKTIAK